MILKEKKSSNLSILLPAVTGGIAVGLSIICYPFVSPALRRVCLPYVPATTVQVANVLRALKGRSGSVLDIGSGDGRIVIASAKQGLPSHGVELNPWLVLYSKFSAATSVLPAPATFSREDLWKFSVKPFDNIVIFGVEEMMNELKEKLDKEMKEDARLIVCRFPLPGKDPITTIGTDVDTVWVYNK